MAYVSELEAIAVLFLAALLPGLAYLSWVRRTEAGTREGWSPVVRAFLFGAFFATLVAAVLEAILVASGTSLSQSLPGPEFVFLNGNTPAGTFFLVLVVAPFVEEGLKALGVVNYRGAIRRVADGPVIGASVGLGFGFFETFLYGLAAFLAGGLVAGLGLILLRALSSMLLHGSSTGLFGYGYAESQLSGRGHGGTSHYFGAVGLHASFNAVASIAAFAALAGLSGPTLDALALLGLALGIVLAFTAIAYVRRLIAQSSYPGALAPHPRFQPPPVRSAQRPVARVAPAPRTPPRRY